MVRDLRKLVCRSMRLSGRRCAAEDGGPYVDWFIERGQWRSRDYEPSPGDIIFFDWESDGLADHVGIVEKVENGLIYTVEGNTGDVCAERRYTLRAVSIYGYGLPLY